MRRRLASAAAVRVTAGLACASLLRYVSPCRRLACASLLCYVSPPALRVPASPAVPPPALRVPASLPCRRRPCVYLLRCLPALRVCLLGCRVAAGRLACAYFVAVSPPAGVIKIKNGKAHDPPRPHFSQPGTASADPHNILNITGLLAAILHTLSACTHTALPSRISPMTGLCRRAACSYVYSIGSMLRILTGFP